MCSNLSPLHGANYVQQQLGSSCSKPPAAGFQTSELSVSHILPVTGSWTAFDEFRIIGKSLLSSRLCCIAHKHDKYLNSFPKYDCNRGLVKIIPSQGMVQHSHRSVCILSTEVPGRDSTQTRTQASPAEA